MKYHYAGAQATTPAAQLSTIIDMKYHHVGAQATPPAVQLSTITETSIPAVPFALVAEPVSPPHPPRARLVELDR